MNFSSLTTHGLSVGGNFTDLISGGIPAVPLDPLASPSAPNFPLSSIPAAQVGTNLDPTLLAILQNPATVRDAYGNPVSPNPQTTVDLGQGITMSFDPATLGAQVFPALDPATQGAVAVATDGEAAFSGTNCRVLIEIPQAPIQNGTSIPHYLGKQLLEIAGITISTHRAKTQVRPFGYINAKGIARGSRTIAGTVILNRFSADVLYRFLQSDLIADHSKDTIYNKLDQLPPFNITLMFSNEQGFVSSQTLYGVEFVTDGVVQGINDLIIEQTLTYYATDLSPLVPFNYSTLFSPSTTQSRASANERTVSSLWKAVS